MTTNRRLAILGLIGMTTHLPELGERSFSSPEAAFL